MPQQAITSNLSITTVFLHIGGWRVLSCKAKHESKTLVSWLEQFTKTGALLQQRDQGFAGMFNFAPQFSPAHRKPLSTREGTAGAAGFPQSNFNERRGHGARERRGRTSPWAGGGRWSEVPPTPWILLWLPSNPGGAQAKKMLSYIKLLRPPQGPKMSLTENPPTIQKKETLPAIFIVIFVTHEE